MENAIKALLIAAGVIVTILIISLAMTIFNKSSSTDDVSTTLSSLEIMRFNQKYEQYEGVKTGGIVKKVLSYIIEENEFLDEEGDVNKGIKLRSNIPEMISAFPSWGDALTTRTYGLRYSSNIKKFSDKISKSRRYKIWYKYNKSGLIYEVHIDNP